MQAKLSSDDQKLIELAKQASEGSFCQMSGFAVGAALLLEDKNGQKHFVQGSNYETQNYRSVCAEKHALQTAHLMHSAAGHSPKILKIAVYSPNHNTPIFPCGDCRQALFEQNPDLQVLCLGSDGSQFECLAKDLLPHGFRLMPSEDAKPSKISSSCAFLKDYIVHFPVHERKLEQLKGIESLIVVGSPVRAAKLAKHFLNFRDWGFAVSNEYCHLKSGDTDREYSLYSVEWPEQNFKVGIASHGIGASGIEIVLSEVSALIALANGDSSKVNPLKAAVRSGTRGTIVDVPLGTVALSTETFNETLSSFPSPLLNQALKEAASELQINLEEGACLSAQFFWTGQGRTPFPLLSQFPEVDKQNEKYLRELQSKGIKWFEMEDYYLNYFGEKYKIATASLGLVIAKRYDSILDKFVLSYSAQAKKDNELLPAEIALQALRKYLGRSLNT